MEPEFIKAYRKRTASIKIDFTRVEKKRKEGDLNKRKVSTEPESLSIQLLATAHFSQKKS